MVRMVLWSEWCHGQGGVMVRMVSWSGWCHGQDVVMVRMVSWSEWCRGQGGVMVRMVSWSCVQVSPHWPHQQHLCTQGRASRTGGNSRLFVFVLLLFAETVGYLFFCFVVVCRNSRLFVLLFFVLLLLAETVGFYFLFCCCWQK